MGTNDSLVSSEIFPSLCQSFTCKKWQDLQPQPFGEGCWAVEQYCIMITQYVNVFICARCLFHVLVNLGIQCDIVRPLPFSSSTHFSHYPRLMIWMLLTHLPSVSTWQLKAESFWKDIWSCGFALGRSRLRLLVCISPTARDPSARWSRQGSPEGKDGKRWESVSCWVLLCLTFPFMWPNR